MNSVERFSAPMLEGMEELAVASLALVGRQKIPEGYASEVLPDSDEKLVIEVNKARAEEVLGRLLRALEAKESPYDREEVRQPHDPEHMPPSLERGSVDHAMFHFNLCAYMRGGIKSNEAAKRLATLYEDHPFLFDSGILCQIDPARIEPILSDYDLPFQRTVASQWVENARRLRERFKGDPRNIFQGVSTYEESQKLIMNDKRGGGFVGFQEKMTSMLIYYLMDDELIEPFNFPVPVDFHVMRVSIANKIIEFPNAPYGTNLYTPETTATLRNLYESYAAEHGVSPLRLCDAVWMLSESSCGRHPGNKTFEPLGRSARSGRSSYLVPALVDVNDSAQRASYAASCGACPIQDTCEYNIPGTQYYVSGNLIIRGPRARFRLPESVVQLRIGDTSFQDSSPEGILSDE